MTGEEMIMTSTDEVVLLYYLAQGAAFLLVGSGAAVAMLSALKWRRHRRWSLPWAIAVSVTMLAVSVVVAGAIFLDVALTRLLLVPQRLLAISVAFFLGSAGISVFGWWVWHLPPGPTDPRRL